METKFITGSDLAVNINNALIRYDDKGKGQIPIIFIHGFPFDKQMWQPQIQLLSKTNRTIAYDIRGYGKSEAGTQMPSIGLYADDLINFMDALEIEKAIVCGLSMGGYILLNAAVLCPERFEAIILCDTQCIADTPEVKESRNKLITKIIAGKKADFAEEFIKKAFCKETLDHKQDVVERVRKVILATSSVSITGSLGAMADRPEVCSQLNKISIPTLVICGEYDTVTPPEQSTLLHKSIKNSKMHLLKRSGHLSNLEQPEEFNQQVLQFIMELSG